MATMKFSSDQIKSLISLYQLHECMWNIHSPSYHDRHQKRCVGQKIADALELPVDAVIKKWANLRTYYLKETQKLEKKNSEANGTGQFYQSDWMYFDHMNEFMHNQCHRRTVANSSYTQMDNDDDPSGSSDSQTLQPDITSGRLSDTAGNHLTDTVGGRLSDIESGSHPAVEDVSQPLENGATARKRQKRLEKQIGAEDPLVVVMRDAIKAMSAAAENDHKAAAAQDELDDYAKTVANSLRNITDVRVREQTKLRINKLLFEARFN